MGKKQYSVMKNVGKSKYVVNYHNGKSKHDDGSDFWDIKIFKNKKSMESFIKDLKSFGFTER